MPYVRQSIANRYKFTRGKIYAFYGSLVVDKLSNVDPHTSLIRTHVDALVGRFQWEFPALRAHVTWHTGRCIVRC